MKKIIAAAVLVAAALGSAGAPAEAAAPGCATAATYDAIRFGDSPAAVAKLVGVGGEKHAGAVGSRRVYPLCGFEHMRPAVGLSRWGRLTVSYERGQVYRIVWTAYDADGIDLSQTPRVRA